MIFALVVLCRFDGVTTDSWAITIPFKGIIFLLDLSSSRITKEDNSKREQTGTLTEAQEEGMKNKLELLCILSEKRLQPGD